MDSQKIHALLTVIRLGSFSAAVDELNCTQPAITQMMNALEDELGVKVLHRDHRGVSLTEDGAKLLQLFQNVEKSCSQLEHEAARLAPAKNEIVHIGAFSSICSNLLPKQIAAYREKHARIAFELKIDTTHLAQLLKSGEIDLAMGIKDACRGCRWKALVNDPFYAVFPSYKVPRNRNYVTEEDFVGVPVIASSFYQELNKSLKIKPEKVITITADDDRALLQMVRAGLGFTAMPKLSLESVAIPAGISALPIKPQISRVIGYALSPTANAAAKDFVRFLKVSLRNFD